MDEPPLVKTAANLFRRYCYEYRDSRIAGILCAGWDKREGGQVRMCGGRDESVLVVIRERERGGEGEPESW